MMQIDALPMEFYIFRMFQREGTPFSPSV